MKRQWILAALGITVLAVALVIFGGPSAPLVLPVAGSSGTPSSGADIRMWTVDSGHSVVTVEHNGRAYRGSSVTTDIVESGVRAFLEVVNRIESTRATAARAGLRTPEAEEAASAI